VPRAVKRCRSELHKRARASSVESRQGQGQGQGQGLSGTQAPQQRKPPESGEGTVESEAQPGWSPRVRGPRKAGTCTGTTGPREAGTSGPRDYGRLGPSRDRATKQSCPQGARGREQGDTGAQRGQQQQQQQLQLQKLMGKDQAAKVARAATKATDKATRLTTRSNKSPPELPKDRAGRGTASGGEQTERESRQGLASQTRK